MNKRILRLAIPNIISNITIPLLGMADTAISGRMGSEAAIASIAIGSTIFNFIYWNCAFLRMGTSGMTAQALGARDLKECMNLLIRAMSVALGIALALWLFQIPIGRFAVRVMSSSEAAAGFVSAYFFARVWAAPATISSYAIHGWFIGMQNAKIPMWVSITVNIVNISVSYLLAISYGMGVTGIAWGTVIAQYTGALMSWVLWYIYYGKLRKYIDWKDALRLKPLLRFFDINKDIFLRTAFNVFVYSFFTYSSKNFGDVLLSTNAILIQLFTFFSYMADGFAYAAEALTGKFTGSRNFTALKHAVKNMFWWSFAIAALFVIVYRIFWKQIIWLFTDLPSIMECAGDYIIWVMVVPLAGFAPFLMDGIMIGATKTKVLRNSMFISAALFFTLYYSLVGKLGNDALWLSFVIFIISRGILQYFMTNRLKDLYR